jgi:hypothetical protein
MRTSLADLADLSLDVLPAMLDERTGLFSHKTVVVDGDYVNQRPNVLYSTVSLVGLLEQRRRPADSVLALGRALDGAHAAVERDGRPGELGNLVWASVLAEDPRGAGALRRLVDVDPRMSTSAELGQVLYGLVIGAGAHETERDRALSTAHACAAELRARYSASGNVFSASPRPASRSLAPRRSLLEGRFASFASQVYPLHGLAALHRLTGEPLPSEAVAVARRIVDCQGPLGQWWWLYSTRASRIVEGYPVYSVHQDGMAFLGLVEIERLGGGGFMAALELGLDWLGGANELGTSLVDRDPPLINRCIQRAGSDADGSYGLATSNYRRTIARSLAPAVGRDRVAAGPEGFEVLRECRSYHLGWLLYAHALIERAAAAGDTTA